MRTETYKRWIAAALVAGALAVTSSTAFATHRIGFQGMFGLGSEFDFDKLGEDDAEATLGMGVFYEYDAFKYFAFGLNTHFLWWNSDALDDAKIDRSMWIDFAPFLKVLYPVFHDKGEIYVKIPVGFSIGLTSDDLEDNYGTETGFGVVAGVSAGFMYEVFDNVGLHLELGWLGHFMKHDLKQGSDTDMKLNQFQLNIGGAYLF